MDKLEEFRPEGLASRILGMGDIVGLVRDFEDVIDAEKAEEDAVRMLQGKFDMQDFLEQIRMIQKIGSLKDIFDKLPFFPGGLPDGVNLDDGELVKIESMISSMTVQERKNPTVFVTTSWEDVAANAGKKKRRRADYDPRRVKRVAGGSGRKEDDVKELLQKFGAMRQMMVQLGASTGLMGKIPGLKQFSQMKKLAGMDLGALMGGDMGQMAGAMGGAMPGGLPASMPGMPPGFTMPGTGNSPAPKTKVGKTKTKSKRKAAKAARKKGRKRK
jgi:signal recognition particle subunit SRP54